MSPFTGGHSDLVPENAGLIKIGGKERLGRELLEFRIANKFKLNCNYLTLCTRELQARDISGIKRADKAMAQKQKK